MGAADYKPVGSWHRHSEQVLRAAAWGSLWPVKGGMQGSSCLEEPSSTVLGGCLASRIKMKAAFHPIKPKTDVFVVPENILRIQTPLCLSKR